LDFLTVALCLSIGNAVAWLLALYTDRGMEMLIWNVAFGVVGATLCALAISVVGLPYGTIWLLAIGPFCGLLQILAGHAIRRVVLRAL